MAILVTGGCGYLGSQLIRDLATREVAGGECIRILDNLQNGEERALMDLPESGRYEFVEGDILDPSTLRVALEDVDTVIHLAAIVRTPFSFEDRNWVEQVNHWGTTHLVEACISADVEQLVYVSTGAVYGPGGPFEEDAECQPTGAYAQSKYSAERTVRTAADRGLQTIVLRLATLCGLAPVIRYDAVANKFAKLAGVKKPLTVFGSGDQRRAFCHVRDASEAICWVLKEVGDDETLTFNVVGENLSIEELAEVVRDAAPESEIRYTEQNVRSHVSLELSGERLERRGFEPQRSLRDGLAAFVGRFRGFTSSTIADTS